MAGSRVAITMHGQACLSAPADDAQAGNAQLDDGTGARALDLLGNWLNLSELERRAFAALTEELSVSSELVEQSTIDLSNRFQQLVGIAQDQMGRVDQVIEAASSLVVDDQPVALDVALQSIEGTLQKAIETVLFVSKHAMRMVYMLEDVTRDVRGAERCSQQIETINRQARYLALNAAIEAARSGGSGGAFGVIANEMKQLAQATESTAVQVRDRIEAVRKGVQHAHDALGEIATVDMTDNIMAKERIDALLTGLLAQHTTFNAVLSQTAASSAQMAGTVGQLVTAMQFQDRTKQHIAQVIDTISVLEAGAQAAQRATHAAFPAQFQPGMIDQERLSRIIEVQKLGAMKARILQRLLGEPGAAGPADADSGGDVELF